MKRSHGSSRTWVTPAVTISSIALLFLFTFALTQSRSSSTIDSTAWGSGFPGSERNLAEKSTLPRLAYLISGTRGDAARVKRLLRALYHPRNYYLLHLDLEASDEERLELARFAKTEDVIGVIRNVMVVGKANLVTSKGPTMMASTLHGVAILLKQASDWDWFINLSASDYPLMPQDDILNIFSYLPRDLNFLEHTSDINWNQNQRARHIIIDPGLYHPKKSNVFWAKERRSMPASFKLLMGSTWVVLTKSFLEFSVWGWDNLPRNLLMYYTNFFSPDEGYFQTIVCNNKDYQKTAVNHDLHYTRWDDLKQHPLNLTLEHFHDMVQSGAPFAREFTKDDPVLNRIDEELLRRPRGRVTPGGWCLGRPSDPCKRFGNPNLIKPTAGSKRLENLLARLLDPESFRSKQCK